MTRCTRTLAAMLLAVSAAACGDSPQAPPTLVPGAFDVVVSAPHGGDQALLITLSAGIGSFAPASGVEAFQNIAVGSATLLVVTAAPLPAGESRIGTFAVADTTGVGGIAAIVVEAARADYRLRDSVSGYGVRLQRR